MFITLLQQYKTSSCHNRDVPHPQFEEGHVAACEQSRNRLNLWRSKQNRCTSCGHCNIYLIICRNGIEFTGCCMQSGTHQWGSTKTRQLGHPRSPANRFRSEHHNFCSIYIGYRFPLSRSTIWGNHLPVNLILKFPTCISTIWRNHLPFNQ